MTGQFNHHRQAGTHLIPAIACVLAGTAAVSRAQFTQPENLSNLAGYWDTSPSMDRDSGNNLHVAWKSWNDNAPASIWYANNVGGFWKKQLLTSHGGGMPGTVCLVISADQVIHILYSTAGGDWTAYELTKPVNEGTWSSPKRFNVSGGAGSLYMKSAVRNSHGGICGIYVYLAESGWNLYGRYQPPGGAWGGEEFIRGGNGNGTFWPQDGWITAHGESFYATYYITGARVPYYKVRSPAGVWGSEIQIAPNGYSSTIAFSPTGEWALTWYNDRRNCELDFTIYSKFSYDQGASWSQPETVSTSCWLSRFPMTAYDANGAFHVAYERLSYEGAPWDVWTRTRAGSVWGPDSNLTNNPGGVRGMNPPNSLTAVGNTLFHFFTETTTNLYEDVWLRVRWTQPQIVLSTIGSERSSYFGHNLPDGDGFTVKNGGVGTLQYTIASGAPWLGVSPSQGSTSTDPRHHSISYQVAGLPVGTHEATMLIADPSQLAFNNPQKITIRVNVLTVRADFDRDGDVDQADFGAFQVCLTGATIPQPAAACQAMRFDADEDVDLNDFAVFQGCMSGANVPADPNCVK